jgi:hypothetical protein
MSAEDSTLNDLLPVVDTETAVKDEALMVEATEEAVADGVEAAAVEEAAAVKEEAAAVAGDEAETIVGDEVVTVLGDKAEAVVGDEAIAEGANVKECSGAKVDGDQETKRLREPVKLGYMVFDNGGDAANYFCKILHGFAPGQDLNEYEHVAVMDLLEKGHMEPEKKKGCGVKSFQVLEHEEGSMCYNIVRTDGSKEDFSYLKCLFSLFPDDATLTAQKAKRIKGPAKGRGGHGGGGGGRGWRGGGRGGGGGRNGGGRFGRGKGGGRGRGRS